MRRAGHRFAVDEQVSFDEMPAARSHHERGDLVVELILLSLGAGELDLAAHRVHEVHLAVDHVEPTGGVGVLEVRHEHLRPGVERIDDHLAIGRSRDLDPAVREVGTGWCHLPVAATNVGRLRQKVGHFAVVDAELALPSGCEELRAAGVEAALEAGDEGQCVVGENLVESRPHRTGDLDTFWHGGSVL